MTSSLISLRAKVLAFLLSLSAIAIYYPALHHQFVTYDDGAHIYRNPRIDPPTASSVRSFWQAPYKGLYVPVTYSVWAGIESIGRLQNPPQPFNPVNYHLANILVHAANVALVFLILFQLGLGFGASSLATLLFAFHPLQVESVAWISSMKDLLCGFFSLLVVRITVAKSKTRSNYMFAFLFYVMAFFSKPSAIALPLFLTWFEVFHSERSWRESIQRYAPWILFSIPFIWLTKMQQPNEAMEYVTPLMLRPVVAFDTLVFYFQKLFFPLGLSLNYGRTPDRILHQGWYLLSLMALIPMSYLVWRWRSSRLLKIFLGLFVLSVLPTLGLIPFYYQKYSTAADRFSYFSLFAAAIAFALIIKQAKHQRVAHALAICFTLVLIFLTRRQLPIWNTDATLVTRIVSVNPSAENHFNLATMLIAELGGSNPVPGTAERPLYRISSQEERRQWESLIEYHFLSAIEKDAEYSFAYNNLGVFYQNQGELKKAEEAFLQATTFSPKLAEAFNNLGVAQAAQARPEEALRNFQRALELEPKFADAKFNLSMAMDELGQSNQAFKTLEEAVALDPKRAQPRFRLATKLQEEGKLFEARDQLLQALANDRENGHFWKKLGQLSLEMKEPGPAQYYFAQARQFIPPISPSDKEVPKP